jgi:putative tricarboxylic transport membrane protein
MDYPLAPLIVALVLGFSTEEALRQSLIMSDGSMAIFFQGPLSSPIMVVALLLFMLPVFQISSAAIGVGSRRAQSNRAQLSALRP